MRDLIDRQAAIDAVEKKIRYTDHDEPVVDWNDFVAALCFLQSAQPEGLACGEGELSAQPDEMYYPQVDGITPTVIKPKLIRCKDCKKFRRWIDTDITFCDCTESEVKEGDFCSRAERRTDDSISN